MLDSQGERDYEVGTASDQSSSSPRGEGAAAERQTVIQPLCGCSVRTESPVVVYTCPVCMGVAMRAIKEIYNDA